MKSQPIRRALLATAALSVSTIALAQQGPTFEVTVTNLTRGQTFTPIVAASHVAGIRIFELGAPASLELEVLAEAGDTSELEDLAATVPEVLDVANSGAPLPPGESVTLVLDTTVQFSYVSVASMLVPTNDTFFAANGVAGPTGEDPVRLRSPGYDAGTEANDELCANIPGPPNICTGEGFNASRADAEGFVHIQAGIHGIGDLTASDQDWRNPVAEITIRRIP